MSISVDVIAPRHGRTIDCFGARIVPISYVASSILNGQAVGGTAMLTATFSATSTYATMVFGEVTFVHPTPTAPIMSSDVGFVPQSLRPQSLRAFELTRYSNVNNRYYVDLLSINPSGQINIVFNTISANEVDTLKARTYTYPLFD